MLGNFSNYKYHAMKRTLLFSFLILFLSTDILYAQDFIQEDIGDSKKEENPIDSLYIPVDDWVGKEVIFLPKSKALQEFGYRVSNKKSEFPVNLLITMNWWEK